MTRPGRSPLRSPDFVSALVMLALGIYLAYQGRDLGLGALSEPGSGFILFWIGLFIAGLALALAITSFAESGGPTIGQLWDNPRWAKVPLVLLYLMVYTAVLETVGFLIATPILLILLFKTVEPQSWTTALVGAFATTVVVYVVFGIGLGTQFPNGLFGFR